jgi:hypothetical protein
VTTVVEYQVRPGFRVRGDITLVAERIEKIKLKHGGSATPEQVFEDARDPDSPLHDCFTWDATEAAHRHNLAEARYLLRSYQVVIKPNNHKPIVICPANVKVIPLGESARYVSTNVAMKRLDYREQVIEAATAEIHGALKRLKGLEALDPETIQAIDEAIAAINRQRMKKRPDREAG